MRVDHLGLKSWVLKDSRMMCDCVEEDDMK